MPDDVTLNINLTLGGPSSAALVKSEADRAVSLAINGVAFRAARNRQRRLQANIQRDFGPIVERELQQMARDVSRLAIGINGDSGRNSPSAVLSISGRISRPMIGNSAPMSIASVTGQWAVRSKAYMKWKMRKYQTRKWFKNTGRMQEQLGKVSTYRNAYGPISIRFTPTGGTGGPNVSNLGRSRGGQSFNIMIGRLEVSPLRRLRLSDLPGIGQQASYNPRLLSPFSDGLQRKLTGHPSKGYRPIIEPFLTYYMTRKIPNAVYRRLEDSLA